jgi:hypothetical protein
MPIGHRVIYALYLTIAISMIVGLAVAIAGADFVALIPNANVVALLSHPLYFLSVYALAFFVAPTVAERFPITRPHQ